MNSIHHIATSRDELNKIMESGLSLPLNVNRLSKNNIRAIKNIVVDFIDEKYLFVPSAFRMEPAGNNPKRVIIRLTPKESRSKIKSAVCFGCKRELLLEKCDKGNYCRECVDIGVRKQDIKVKVTTLAQTQREVFCLSLSQKIPTLWLIERDCSSCNNAGQNGGKCEVNYLTLKL